MWVTYAFMPILRRGMPRLYVKFLVGNIPAGLPNPALGGPS